MARTFAQLRQLTAQQLGLTYITGTVAATGNSTTTMKDTALSVYANDRLDGYWVLLTSGSPSATELLITAFTSSTGVATFSPTLTAAPDSLTYEISPFNGTDYLRAMQDATMMLYDSGLLVRQFTIRMVTGSPLYNSDWSYWTSATAVDGWTKNGTSTLARERASGNVHTGETSLKMSGVADYVSLDAYWKRFLWDMRNQTVTFYCPVLTSTASAGRINLVSGTTNNYSPYHGGGGDWELLSVQVALTDTVTNIEPRLYNDTTAAVYFGMPFIIGGIVDEYPFPISVMPDGPTELQVSYMGLVKDSIASGRGKVDLRQLGSTRNVANYDWHRFHNEDSTNLYGVLDLSNSRGATLPGMHLEAIGEGPLTLPATNLSTINFEVTQTESLLLATLTAIKLLERLLPRAPMTIRQVYSERIGRLQAQYKELSAGVGPTRSSSGLPLRW